MKNSIVVITNPSITLEGISIICEKMSHCRANAYAVRGNQRANCKSLMGMLSLNLKKGNEIEITAEGEEEDKITSILSDYLTKE